MDQGFHAITAGISVHVSAFYLEEQSKPEAGHFVWAYRVKITNGAEQTVQLLRRTWNITDAQGHVVHVEGEGVVGQQPVLAPGESFEYTSGTPLPTPSGFMTGQYHMLRRPGGEAFDIAIPVFSLDSPYHNNRVN